jgi:EmrB/QacA subfamily drug resistance transporter
VSTASSTVREGGRSVLVAYGGIMLTILLAALDQTIVATALPQIVGDLQGFEQLSWIITAYLIASTVTVPLYGRLSDLYGRRRLFVVAISIFLLGSALCGAAQSMGQLVAFRALQGVGAGGLIPLSLSAVADLFPPRERGRYQGYIGAVWATAAIAGPLVGGTLTDAASWRWIFLINLPLGALALLVVLRTMPPAARRSGARIDVAGAALLTAAVTLILLAVSWGGATHPWASAPVLGAAVAGGVLGLAFLRHAGRTPEPLLPLGLFRDRVVAVSTSATFVVGAVLFAVTVYVPVFVQGVLGGTATESGLALIPLSIGWVSTSVAAGQVVARTGRYRIFPIVGGVLVVAGAVMLAGMDAGPRMRRSRSTCSSSARAWA